MGCRWLGLGAVVVLVLCGCGSQTSVAEDEADAVSTGPASEYIAPISDDTAGLVEDVRAGFERWAGGIYDHQAAAVVRAHWYNGPQDACLDEAHVPFEGWPGWEVAISPTNFPDWFTEGAVAPPVRAFSFEPQLNTLAGRLEPLQRVVPPEEYQKTIDGCSGEGDVGPEDDLFAYTNPAVVEDLDAEWRDTVGEVAQDIAPDAEILQCLTGSTLPPPFDIPPGADAEPWMKVLDRLEPDSSQIPLPGEDPSLKWTAYLDAEEILMTAIWECHDDTFDEAMVRMAEASEEFAVEHADQIAGARAAWARTRDMATELGWAPERPLAGFPLDKVPGPPQHG